MPKTKPRTINTVITHLEMASPPPHSAVAPAVHKLALLRAERCTVSFYRYLYNAVGEPWFWWERRAMDDEALADVIQDARTEIYVLYADGVPAGYAELDRREPAAVDLAYLGLVPDFIGRGLGAFLLDWAADAAWAVEGVEKLTVNTCNLDHPKALGLYQRAGFQAVRQERRTIDDPRDTGLIPPETPLPPGARSVPAAKQPAKGTRKGGKSRLRALPGGADAGRDDQAEKE